MDTEMVKRMTEYCNELYNQLINPDQNTLINREVQVYANLTILKSEVENDFKNLKLTTGVNNIPGELFINNRTQLIDTITELCQQIWDTKEWPSLWKQSLIIPIPKKGVIEKCENYRTISMISHASRYY